MHLDAMARKRPVSRVKSYRQNSSTVRQGLGELVKVIFILGLKIVVGLVFIAGISLGLIYGYRLVTGSNYFALKQIEIEGCKHLTYGEITSSLGLNLGQNILDLNIAELQYKLSKNPWIKKVYVRRELPDKIRIAIVERQAYFWVKYGQKLFYANRLGERIAEVLPKNFISLPVLYVDAQCTRAKEQLPIIVSLLDKKKFPFSWQDLAGIHLTSLNRMEAFLEKPRLKLSLDMDEILENVHRLSLVWKDLRNRGELNKVNKIHVLKGQVWVGFR